MKEIVLITGANGNLAKTVGKLLSETYEIRSLTTNKKNADGKSIFYWNINKKHLDIDALKECKHIIHLCGYSILKRWTVKNKQLMHESRIGGANLLFNKCQELKIFPKTFISASASGIYGIESNGIKKEGDKVGSDWVARMVYQWEIAAQKFKQLESRVIKMRISLLLSKESGFLKYTLLSMRYGIGIILGYKEHPINWIHINDAARFVKESIENNAYQGSYNLANEETISKYKFMKVIKMKASPYSLIITIPTYLTHILFGKRSLILNNKIILSVKKLKKIGFFCKYNKLEDVLEN